MYRDFKRMCKTIVLLVKHFIWWRSHWRRRRDLLKLTTGRSHGTKSHMLGRNLHSGTSKQRQARVDWYELLCVGSHNVQLAFQHVWFCTMWPVRAKRLLEKTLRKTRRQRQRERHQTIGLKSKTIAVHVRYKYLYISLPSSAKQQCEMTKFCVIWITWTTTTNSAYFYLKLNAFVAYSAGASLNSHWIDPNKWEIPK